MVHINNTTLKAEKVNQLKRYKSKAKPIREQKTKKGKLAKGKDLLPEPETTKHSSRLGVISPWATPTDLNLSGIPVVEIEQIGSIVRDINPKYPSYALPEYNAPIAFAPINAQYVIFTPIVSPTVITGLPNNTLFLNASAGLPGELNFKDNNGDVVAVGGGGSSLHVPIYYDLTDEDITNGFMTLPFTPSVPTAVCMDVAGGWGAAVYGVDFAVSGDLVYWNGLALHDVLDSTDSFRLTFFA